ncbi:rhamnan synthesis F family protein [Roseovarius sp. S1116L3]|uniref:rhamnan synthesis F family protein n=1 Tax=Roseovarius roseus TaxID=3342636 RepID=UPI00372B8CC3
MDTEFNAYWTLWCHGVTARIRTHAPKAARKKKYERPMTQTTFLGHKISRPSYIPMTAWLRHGPFAMWLVQAARPRTIVELGSHYGYSYFAFCQAVTSAGLPTRCIAVDTWQGDEHSGRYGEDVFEAVRAQNQPYEGFSTLLRRTFAEALADVEDGSVDVLHVDGRHFYDDVKEDYESWIPKLSDRAVVLFHDTEVRERGFGVWRYWEELAQAHPAFNFPYQHGLGVLFRGEDLSPEMGAFRRLVHDDAGRDAVTALFAAQGEALAADHTLNELAAKVASGPDALSQLLTMLDSGDLVSESQLRPLDAGAKSLSEALEAEHAKQRALSARINDLSEIVSQYQAQTLDLQAESRDLQAESRDLRATLAQARWHPGQVWKERAAFLVLRWLASSGLPLSERRRNRFARSAQKRDPSRSLIGAPGAPEQTPQVALDRVPTSGGTTAKVIPGRRMQDPARGNVLLVSHEASQTGAPILVQNVARVLSERYNVTVLCLRGGDLLDAMLDVSVGVVVAGGGYSGPNSNIRRFLKRYVSETRPDFTIVNSVVSAPILPILSRMDIPTVWLIHEFVSFFPSPQGPFHDFMKYSDSVVFSSPLTLEDAHVASAIEASPNIRILPQGKCLVPSDGGTPTGTDSCGPERERLTAKLRPPGEEDTFVVIGAGHVQRRKGTDLFIEVARHAMAESRERADGRKLRFAWIGDGFDDKLDPPYFLSLQDQLKRAGVSGDVLFVSATRDIDYAYELADMLVLPSRLDPLPNVAIDAMIAGLPVLCFESATGIAGTLKDIGVAEACVAEYINTADMTYKLLALADDAALYDRVSTTLRDRAPSMFDMEAYVAELESLALNAGARREARKADAATIAAEQCFEEVYVRFPGDALKGRESTAKDYLERLSRAATPRRPEPGFNPHIFRMHQRAEGQPETSDPYADFLRQGRPEGPWALQVIRDTVPASPTDDASGLRVALQIHAYYIDLLPRLRAHLEANQLRPDLFVSTTSRESAAEARSLLDGYSARTEVRMVPNVGRDVAPLLTCFGPQLVHDYDVIGHVHTKKSLFLGKTDVVETWVNLLYENILGGETGGPMIDRILNAMAEAPDVGIVFPSDPSLISWSRNRDQSQRLARKLGLDGLPEIIDFPVGTMFWMRAEALRPFVELGLRYADYPAEPIADDGTMLHALERLFGVAPVLQGYRAAVTYVTGLTR